MSKHVFKANVTVTVEFADNYEDALFIVNNALGSLEELVANDNQFTEVQVDLEFADLTDA